MIKPTRTLKQITYPNGRTEIATKTSTGYRWQFGNATSSTLHQLEVNVAAYDATIGDIPNPHYEADLAEYNRRAAERAAARNPLARLFR
jgi:hypothetical protein